MADAYTGVALLLVDIQNDFIDGSLAITDAESILPAALRLIEDRPFPVVISSQDFHPPSHVSFASRHSVTPFQSKTLSHPNATKASHGATIEQMMWPDHCIQGTRGAEFHPAIKEALTEHESKGRRHIIVQKGTHPDIDGYSAFAANDYLSFTELPKILFSQTPPIHTLVLVGLAADYCLLSSAVDAAKFNLRTIVIEEGIRGTAKESSAKAIAEMKDWGIEVIKSDQDLTGALLQRGRVQR